MYDLDSAQLRAPISLSRSHTHTHTHTQTHTHMYINSDTHTHALNSQTHARSHTHTQQQEQLIMFPSTQACQGSGTGIGKRYSSQSALGRVEFAWLLSSISPTFRQN